MREVEFLVLGQGVVGSLLARQLAARGRSFAVADRGHATASSYAAAGLVNPVTGRRFVKTWLAERLTAALDVYAEVLPAGAPPIVQPLTILRDLSATASRNTWALKRGDEGLANYLGPAVTASQAHSRFTIPGDVRVPAWVGPTVGGYRVDLRRLLMQTRAWLRDGGRLIEDEVLVDRWLESTGAFALHGLSAKHVIDASGAAAMHTRAWSALPWRGTLGEAWRFAAPSFPREVALKRRHFVSPVGDAGDVWIGGTNADGHAAPTRTPEGQAALLEAAHRFAVRPMGQPERLAAIRPTVRDRRPLLGRHPAREGLWLCNGMGTKGASLAPFFTRQLLAHVLEGEALSPEVDIARRFTG